MAVFASLWPGSPAGCIAAGRASYKVYASSRSSPHLADQQRRHSVGPVFWAPYPLALVSLGASAGEPRFSRKARIACAPAGGPLSGRCSCLCSLPQSSCVGWMTLHPTVSRFLHMNIGSTRPVHHRAPGLTWLTSTGDIVFFCLGRSVVVRAPQRPAMPDKAHWRNATVLRSAQCCASNRLK